MSNKTGSNNRPPRNSNNNNEGGASGDSGARRDETNSGGGNGGGGGGQQRNKQQHNHHHHQQHQQAPRHRNQPPRQPNRDADAEYEDDSSTNALGQENRNHRPHNNNNNNSNSNKPRSYRKMHEMTANTQQQQHSDTHRGGNNNHNRGRVQDRNYSKKATDSGDDDGGGGDGGGAAEHNESRFSFDKSSRRQLLSVSSTSGAVGPAVPSGVSCICCLHDLHTYVYYQCSHFVCLNCAVKMRVLCQKLDCPACRQDSKNVICTKQSEIDFDSLLKQCSKARPISFETTTPRSALLLLAASNPSSKMGSMNPRDLVDYGICFDDDRIHDEYEEILENKCTICSEHFARFDELDQHLRRVHKRFYCELCLENLKLFPYERKFYDSNELGRHRRVGDQDDYSFKGHPRCEHCDQRFFDRDELYRHYRKEHYYCHFCDSDGQEEYYNNYEELRKHFLKFHHLCEIDGCSANAAQTHEYVVFRTEIDFQAHKREKHAKSSKDAKALSKLNIEFSINDSGRVRAGGGGGGYRAGPGPKKPTGGRSGGGGASANAVDSTSDDDSGGPSAGAAGTSNRQRNAGASNADYQRSSRDNYETEEDRKRQRNLQKLREKHENYEQTMAEAAAAVIAKAPTSSTLNPIEPQEAEKKMPEAAQPAVASAAAPSTISTWSIMAGSGGVKPTINNTAEFPSLGAPSSLAAIGATIAAKASWAQPAANSKVAGKSESLSGSEVTTKKQPSQQKLNLKLAQKNKKSKILSDSSGSESEGENESTETESKVAMVKASLPPPTPPPSTTVKSPPTGQKSSPAPPPGFSSPGIESKILPIQSPPPGFVKAASAVVDEFPSLAAATVSSKPVAAANKENETTTTGGDLQFLKPKNYEERNSELSKKLFRLFGGSFNETEFNEFKSKSNDFRLGKLSAKEYVKKCHQLLDLPLNAQAYPASTSDKAIEQSLETHKKFLNLIQEMIVLLPDVKKQSELYKAFETSFEGLSDKLLEMATGKKSSKKAGGGDVDLEKMIARCDFCPQYLLFEEMSDHEHRHHKSELVKKQIQSNKAAMAEAVKGISATSISSSSSSSAAKSKVISEDFPSLASTVTRPAQAPVPVKNWAASASAAEPVETKPKQATKQVKPLEADEFPALGGGLAANGPRFSTMPTPNLFANPSAHLSLVHKKKHRLMK